MGKETATKGAKFESVEEEFAAEPDELEFNSCVFSNGTTIARMDGPAWGHPS
jgi:hypothetical protein